MDIHDLLNSFIDRKSPRPARFLTRMWGDQQKAVTYHELRDAILNGSLSLDYLTDWQKDYSVFLSECYGPVVDEAAKAAHEMLAAQYGGYLQDPMHGLMDDYIQNHGGRLIREISEGQYRAINTLVRQAALTETLTVDELARAIRPCIGLTENQSMRCKKFYEQLREDGYSKKDALKKEANFAAKLHRERAALIAQTELAYAANEGMDAVIRQNVEQGIISPDVEKEWSTARDERVCPVCGTLHGEKVPENQPFSNGSMLPPAHPGCRCAVKYHLKAPERPAQAAPPEPQEPPPDSEEWFEGGKVSPETYDQVAEELWENDFEPSNKDVREMVDAVYEYTGADYTDILASEAGYGGRFAEYSNDVMNSERRAVADQNVRRINEYLEMAPKHEGTVYRALGFDVGGELDQGGWEEFRAAHQVGNTVATDTMSSWTKRKDVMQQIFANRAGLDETAEYSVEVAMTMRDGKRGVDISRLAELQAQDEVLFPKTSLKVLSYKERWVRDELLKVEIEVSEVLPEWMRGALGF